jgi:nucleotide-binding universal stress UspA family protein
VRIGRPSRLATEGADEPNRIIIGVDGSANAAAAVSAVAQRVWPTGSEFKVITAVDIPLWVELLLGSGAADSTANNEEHNLSFARPPVQSAVEELRGKNLVATPVIVEGDPKQLLVDEAKRWEADCIFLGAKGRGRLERLLLGSVSAAVAARAHCSVEVVRHESACP